MLAIKAALAGALELKNILQNQALPTFLAEQVAGLNVPTALLSQLVDAFKDNSAGLLRDGNFIRAGFDANLDTLINIRDHSRRLIDDLKNQYAASTGIANLKIIYNNMLGYFIEVTAQNAKKLPENFIHRQTMANAMRFSTPELNEIQTKILTAAADALKIEQQIFADVAAQIVTSADSILQTANAISWLDFAASLAALALGSKYVRPVVDDSNAFEITSGRHPVVELTCNFTANSCNLTGQKIWLLTGPNMAGKSTFLRQNVLIALLAQIGSFVPAEAAHIGCVDKIFSRVGASDNLARGQSTFMVEMLETAQILNEATQKSLVILDEIGRGTSTYDGLSIAWAVLEHLHNSIKCRAIFATHYHELTQLVLPRINLHAMKVREWKGDIVFLHEVGAGAAEKSYGIHVAKLAGLPPEVVRRAGEVLKGLEQKSKAALELPLFATQPEPEKPIENEALALLAATDPNTLSPKDALDLIYKLKYINN
jgi:DNA mismatch repair protein MutS